MYFGTLVGNIYSVSRYIVFMYYIATHRLDDVHSLFFCRTLKEYNTVTHSAWTSVLTGVLLHHPAVVARVEGFRQQAERRMYYVSSCTVPIGIGRFGSDTWHHHEVRAWAVGTGDALQSRDMIGRQPMGLSDEQDTKFL